MECLPEGGLEERLSQAREQGRRMRVKFGIDPTAPDIHLGHAVALGKLREFQQEGHRVILIVGDLTARVGDPSGRSTLRPILSEEEIEANGKTFQEQASRILDTDADLLEVRHNSEWLDMGMGELLALARTTTVAQVLEREDFSKRWSESQPISMLELLYPLLQAYDSVAVRADVEVGGTDQKFNLLLGRDVQRAYGQVEQSILTMPILSGTDGKRKMSKSLGNQIGITDPPGEMYGKTMSIPDETMGEYYELLLRRDLPEELSPRDAKRMLASGDRRLASLPGGGSPGRGGVRPGVRRGPTARGDPRARLPNEHPRAGPPAGRDRGRVRHLPLGGPAADRPGSGLPG